MTEKSCIIFFFFFTFFANHAFPANVSIFSFQNTYRQTQICYCITIPFYNKNVCFFFWWDLSFARQFVWGVIFWDVTLCAVLHTICLPYTVQSLTVSLSLLRRFGQYSGRGLLYQDFMITLRHTTFGRTPLDE